MTRLELLRKRFGITAAPSGPRHGIERVRHELKRRALTVTRVEELTPRMRRLVLSAPDLADFYSPSPDDHIKLFFRTEDGRDVMRDFTPRSYDREARTLTIDFALHEAGPATTWARSARVGDSLAIGGPRGSQLVTDDFDWYVLVADEAAIPAMLRRVEELRPGVPVHTFALVADDLEVQQVETEAAWSPVWIRRGEPSEHDARIAVDALANVQLPPGEGYVWIAAEASVARALRTHFVEGRRHPRAWLRAAGYWQRGQADAHVEIGD